MTKKRRASDDYFLCPCCGARLAVDAKFCRECGADAEVGWDPEGLDSGPSGGYQDDDDDFDYDEFIAREFPQHAEPQPGRLLRRAVWTCVVLTLCAALILLLFFW
jgi:ribosomal protein L40E